MSGLPLKDLETSGEPASEIPPVSDLYLWAVTQADYLRSGRLNLADAFHIADEIDDVGHAEYDKLESAMTVLLQHMLKWDFQPKLRSRSWELTIDEQRDRVTKQLRRNPSLRTQLPTIVTDAFRSTKRRVYIETSLPKDTFADLCPYNWTDITDRPFTHEV